MGRGSQIFLPSPQAPLETSGSVAASIYIYIESSEIDYAPSIYSWYLIIYFSIFYVFFLSGNVRCPTKCQAFIMGPSSKTVF